MPWRHAQLRRGVVAPYTIRSARLNVASLAAFAAGVMIACLLHDWHWMPLGFIGLSLIVLRIAAIERAAAS